MGCIVIPEKSYGKSFWAKCKALERSFYENNNLIEAARFYRKSIFEKLKGYNEKLIIGEDWDISQRAKKLQNVEELTLIFYIMKDL